jgi:glycosyltransferase involved in cell wall biosynthesis
VTAGASVAGSRTRQLRVLHIAPASFGAGGLFGGGERYPYELAKAMTSHCTVRFLTFGSESARYHDDALAVRVLRSRAHWKGSEVNPLSEALFAELGGADVIHVHQWESVVANACVIGGRLFGKQVYATDLGGSGPNYWRRLRLNRLLTGFLPCSRFGAEFYPELIDKAHVILGGVDLRRFCPDPGSERSHRALFVGRLLPHKGIDLLIDALPSTLDLLVVGRAYDRAYRDYLHTQARGKRVEFRESVEDDELIEAYRTSRVVILPSVYHPTLGPPAPKAELLGLTLLEAMACATPVVCTDVGGMPEIVTHGETGFVVSPDDPAAMATALSRLVEDDGLWRSMSSAALERARTLSWDAVAQRCVDLYESSGSTVQPAGAGPR